MRRTRRFANLAASSVVAFSSLLTIGIMPIAHAAPGSDTCVWTGLGDGTTFGDDQNWSGCSSAAPVAGDVLEFGVLGSSTSFVTLTNDLDLDFGGVIYGDSTKNTSVETFYTIDNLDLADNA